MTDDGDGTSATDLPGFGTEADVLDWPDMASTFGEEPLDRPGQAVGTGAGAVGTAVGTSASSTAVASTSVTSAAVIESPPGSLPVFGTGGPAPDGSDDLFGDGPGDAVEDAPFGPPVDDPESAPGGDDLFGPAPPEASGDPFAPTDAAMPPGTGTGDGAVDNTPEPGTESTPDHSTGPELPQEPPEQAATDGAGTGGADGTDGTDSTDGGGHEAGTEADSTLAG